MEDRSARIARITGQAVVDVRALSGGCVGQVLLVQLADGCKVVAKLGPGLEPEGWMLRKLAAESSLPVPMLLYADDDLLLMNYIDARDRLDDRAQEHAAELLAGLHQMSWHAYGLERATLIGGLVQPNPPTASWREFFRDHRLLFMAGEALEAGRLPAALMAGIERLGARLDRWIDEAPAPGMIHGDCWGGNVLCRQGRVAAFIDPAIYYADPEIELAFGTLFSDFGPAFFRRYNEIRPLRPGFFEARRDLYNLYPLLVHVRLFGGSYVDLVDDVVRRYAG